MRKSTSICHLFQLASFQTNIFHRGSTWEITLDRANHPKIHSPNIESLSIGNWDTVVSGLATTPIIPVLQNCTNLICKAKFFSLRGYHQECLGFHYQE
ncbi:hypothetical protein CEXT_399401 [Caerostris extrusa]|uniref:Uncharacterized protein n=1 Tax=Caerostris extrusa TaxID=172846 RepID=A0AAV4QSU4_CAEEX|nr:hypothetical protein CEXT_399401 [Caerostris extrusa]